MAPDSTSRVDENLAESSDEHPGSLVLRATNVHIDYQTAVERNGLRQRLTGGSSSSRTANIRAVRGVSLDLHRGETLGVIGHNGCGKSSLMQGLAGLVPLSQGEVSAIARPTLLGINAALNAKLSGRRNLTLGCLAQGMSLATVRSQMDELIEFTGLGEFIDIPLEAYSTGMKTRLSFTVATAITPDILLLDEALAGGDREFRDRATKRLDKVREDTGAVILVSHSMAIMRRMCSRVVWMSHGEVVTTGPTDEVIDEWEASQPERIGDQTIDRGKRKKQFSDAVVVGDRALNASAIDLPPQDFIIAGFTNCGSTSLARQINTTGGVNVGRRKPKPGAGLFECDATTADFVPEARFWVEGVVNGHQFSAYALSKPRLEMLHDWSPNARIIVTIGKPLETLYRWFDEYREVAENGGPEAHAAMKDRDFYRTCSLDEFYGFYAEARLTHAVGINNVIDCFGAEQTYVIDWSLRQSEPDAAADFLSRAVECPIGLPSEDDHPTPTIVDRERDESLRPSAKLSQQIDDLHDALVEATDRLPAENKFF